MIQLSMLTVAAGLIWREGRLLIAQRNAAGPHALKWEFPGGKLEEGETPKRALRRELEEELGIDAQIGLEISRYEYCYPGKSPIFLVFFEVRQYSGKIRNLGAFAELAWEAPNRLSSYDFLEGDLALIQLLCEIHINQVH